MRSIWRRREGVKPSVYWSVTKYEDVIQVEKHPEIFSSARIHITAEDRMVPALALPGLPGSAEALPSVGLRYGAPTPSRPSAAVAHFSKLVRRSTNLPRY